MLSYMLSLDAEEEDEKMVRSRKTITERRPKPVLVLGKGCGTFTHKLDALLYGLSLETTDLEEYCNSVIAITTDQGVEFQVANAPSISSSELQQDWAVILNTETQAAHGSPSAALEALEDEPSMALALAPAPAEPDAELAVRQSEPGLDEPLLPASQFPNALRIPGLKHICDNLLHASLTQMKMWQGLVRDLRCIEILLRRVPYRERFLYSCVDPQDEHASQKLMSWSCSLKGLRWEAVCEFTLNAPRLFTKPDQIASSDLI